MKFDHYLLNIYVPERDGPPKRLYDHWIEQALLAEDLGYDTVWVTEHHFRAFGGLCPNPQLMLAALAARTTRIRLGTAVTILPLHHPIRIAEDMAMLDTLSGGRLEVGVGRGMPQAEYAVFGTRWEDSQERLEEAVALIRRAWTGEPFHWQGRHFHVPEPIRAMPPPMQAPAPALWCTANFEPEHFRWIGHQGLNLMTLPWLAPSNERIRELIGLWRQALAEAGHDPATRELLVMYFAHVNESAAAAEAALHAWLARMGGGNERGGENLRGLTAERYIAETRAIVGDPARCRQHVAFIRDSFAPSHIATVHHFGPVDQSGALASMRLFASAVAPPFRL